MATDAKASAKVAAELHRKACDGGYGVSCVDLADMYDNGNGVTKDPAQAKAMRERACKAGVLDECSQR